MAEVEIVPKTEIERLEAIRRDQLSLLFQIGQMMQGTVDLDRLLHLILTCVTAGEALGFNRALLFLIDERENILRGEIGVGPADLEDARYIWSELSRRKPSLEELLNLYEKEPGKKSKLDELCKQIRLPLKENADIIVQTVVGGKPVIIRNIGADTQVDPQFRDILKSNSFAIAPLMARDKIIGAIVADNLYSQRQITEEQLEILTLFGLQAGLAIERTRMHESLVESEKLAATGRLAANIAHEIRTPLIAIGGFARLIEKDLSDAEANRERVKIIISEVERLENVIREVLDFLRPLKRSLSRVDMNDLINNIVFLMKESLQERRIEVVLLLSPNVPQIEMDTYQFKEVLMNLVRNAIFSMPQGGRLTIKTEEGDKYIKISISDTGMGIAEELQDKIFEPFFTTATGGTGLGLAISTGVVEEHGGEIRVESAAGQGATFSVILPISEEGRE